MYVVLLFLPVELCYKSLDSRCYTRISRAISESESRFGCLLGVCVCFLCILLDERERRIWLVIYVREYQETIIFITSSRKATACCEDTFLRLVSSFLFYSRTMQVTPSTLRKQQNVFRSVRFLLLPSSNLAPLENVLLLGASQSLHLVDVVNL